MEKATRKPVLRAAGRADWFGWVELSRAEVDGVTTGHTAEVIREVDADVLCLVEVEDRTTLERFNTQALEPLGVDYPHSLLVDGNDPRGIDIGLYSRFPVRSVLPHIDDVYTGADGRPYRVFSRDCPEFEIVIPGKRRLWVLGNHLKSQGYGSKAGNDRKRRLQSDRVVAILKRYKLKRDWVVVAGDLNDFPDSKPLEPLTQHPDLHDVLKTPHWTGPDWTYHSGKKRLDYLFVSTALRSKLKAAGINRRGIFQRSSASNPEPCLPTITSTANQASDHAAVWAEFTI